MTVRQPQARRIQLRVNGREHALELDPHAPLLAVLRNDLGLNGPKYGCGLGQCGACTVLVDGVAARACVIPVGGVQGREIVTLEGLGTREHPHPVQQGFVDAQAAQCGYCLNGMVMTTAALLAREPDPDDARIVAELSGNLCRCGTHVEIVQAVHCAARRLREARVGQGAAQGAGAASRADAPGAAAALAAEGGTALPAEVGTAPTATGTTAAGVAPSLVSRSFA